MDSGRLSKKKAKHSFAICLVGRSLSSATLDHCAVDLWLEQGAFSPFSFNLNQDQHSSCLLRGSDGIRHFPSLGPSCAHSSSNATRQNQHDRADQFS